MIIAVDFDGTCVTHEFPLVGKDIGAVFVLKELVNAGHKLILFTMRSDRQKGQFEKNSLGWDNPENIILKTNVLEDAINWFKDRDIPLYGINNNPQQDSWTSSLKAYAQLYIDDAALGCPLMFNSELSHRHFVDWDEVRILLIKNRVL